MITDYPSRGADAALLTFSDMDLGIRALSSALKARGFSVLLGFFGSWQDADEAGLQAILQWVRETDPRVIGISTAEIARGKALRLIPLLRAEGRTVVAGGVDATLNPDVYLAQAEYVIRGEGEDALAELLEAVRGGQDPRRIPGLWLRDGTGATVRNAMRPAIADLDALPHEDVLDVRHHYEFRDGTVRQKRRFVQKMRVGSFNGYGQFFFTLRGCAFSCTFCSNHAMEQPGPRIRKRSVGAVIARIEQLKKADPAFGIAYFFEDDFFLRTADEIRLFAAEWKRRIDLPFFAYGSPVTVTEEKLRDLVDAGLFVVNVGIQTGSERINAGLFGRKMDNRAALATAALLRKYVGRGRFGLMPPVYDLIMNNPYETGQDLRATLDLLRALPKPYLTFMNSLVLFQGTKLHGKAVRDGLLAGADGSSAHHYHDALRHFDTLVRRGGNYYLNSLLFWMSGRHTARRYGLVPAAALGFLTGERAVRFFNAHPRLVHALNRVLPTHKRVERAMRRFSDRFAKY